MTLENTVTTKLSIDGQTTELRLLDTAGEESLSCMVHQSIVPGDGFLLVYSITDRDSFNSIEQFFEQVKKIKATDQVGIVIVANKLDQEHDRKVSTEEGQQLAKRLNRPFIETSAKTRTNLTQVFSRIVGAIRRFDEPASHFSPAASPRSKKSTKEAKEKVANISFDDIATDAVSPTKKSSSSSSGGGGCLAIFRKRSKSESSKSSVVAAPAKEKEIIVAHM